MHQLSGCFIQQLLRYFSLDPPTGIAILGATPLAWLKRPDLQWFRVPVVMKLIISVGLQWKSLRPIGHISLFKGGVDLDAKVSCQKAFILSNQLVACLTMTDWRTTRRLELYVLQRTHNIAGHSRSLTCL